MPGRPPCRRPAYLRARLPVKPAPAFAVAEPLGPRSTSDSISFGAGACPPPVENCTSASWVIIEAPLFRVMSRRRCRYSAVRSPGMSYDFVRNRPSKLSPERVSRVLHSLPSVEPWRAQSFGSRVSKSFAEVSA